MTSDDIIRDLKRHVNAIARAAQDVYDNWDQVDGYSEAYGTGGICDDVAAEICRELERAGYGCFTLYNEYETHTAAYVYDESAEGAYEGEYGALIRVDIHPSNYEDGYGYTWRKIPDVRFSGGMVRIEDYSHLFEEYVDFL